MESADVFPICEDLIGDDWTAWVILSLASYIALLAGLGWINHGKSFKPTCALPYNDRLYCLLHSDSVVIDSDGAADSFCKNLRGTKHIYLDFHAAAVTSDAAGHLYDYVRFTA